MFLRRSMFDYVKVYFEGFNQTNAYTVSSKWH